MNNSGCEKDKKAGKIKYLLFAAGFSILIFTAICLWNKKADIKSNPASMMGTMVKKHLRHGTSEKQVPLKDVPEDFQAGDYEPNSKNDKHAVPDGTKTAYLSFDDGPSANNTPRILDILDNYKIKATFFLIGQHAQANKDLVEREWSSGDMVYNHTYDHNVDFIYKDPKNLVEDLNECDTILKSLLPGYDKKVCRFPGGSKNRPAVFKAAVAKAGYRYVDWNCLTRDAEVPNLSIDQQLGYIKQFSKNKKDLIVLMHDDSGETTTPDALPRIIDYLKSCGYAFKTIN
ncbi:MAG: polysaccharide deacetylase family protein [Bacillota bacterium]|nr:polysaccharide deacetylase family protein [Bacillota bacterium]